MFDIFLFDSFNFSTLIKNVTMFYFGFSSISSIASTPLVFIVFIPPPRLSADAAIRRREGTWRGTVASAVSREGV